MSIFQNDVNIIHNCALGSYLLWRYALSYRENNQEADLSPGILLFLILPMLFHYDTFEFVNSTYASSGLTKFVSKFIESNNQKADYLLSIQDRASRMKKLTMESIQIGIIKRLFFIEEKHGKVIPALDGKIKEIKKLPVLIEKYGRNAEKIGNWFSNKRLAEISNLLKVVF